MRVPTRVTGRVGPSSQGLGYLSGEGGTPEAFGAGLGRGLGRLAAGFEQRAVDQENEQLKRQRFEANKSFILEETETQKLFQDQMNAAPLGAEGFTEQVEGTFKKRHDQILNDMRQRGVHEDVVNETELKLTNLRGNIVTEGLKFQERSYKTKVVNDVTEVGTNLQQSVSFNPYEVEGALQRLNEQIDLIPNLDAPTKEAMKKDQAAAIKMAAGMGLAQNDPGYVVQKLGGGGKVGPTATRIKTRLINHGFTDAQASGIIGNLMAESGLRTGVVNSIGAAGIAQWYKTRRTDLEKFAEARGKPWTDLDTQVDFLVWELNNSPTEQLAMRELKKATTVEEAAAAFAHFERAEGYTPENPRGIHNWTGRRANSFKAAGIGALPAEDGKTGDPVLDGLDFAERQKVLNYANTVLNQEQASNKAALERDVENATSSYLNTGEYAGRVPTANDFAAAYDPIEAEQRYAAFEGVRRVGGFISEMKTMSETEIASMLNTLRPSPDSTSPTLEEEWDAFEKAETAAKNVIKQRTDDPANYVLKNFPSVQGALQAVAGGEQGARQVLFSELNSAYDTLGILPSERRAFTDQGIRMEKERFAAASPAQKVDMLVGLRAEAGPLFQNALRELDKAGMTTEAYLAGLVAYSPEHKQVAEKVLLGKAIIEQDKTKTPKWDEANGIYNDMMQGVDLNLPPNMATAINEAAAALYIFEGGDPKNIVASTQKYQDAVRQVLGGIKGDTDTGLWYDTFGYDDDKPTILPPTIRGAEFEAWKDGLVDSDLVNLSKNGSGPFFADGVPATAEDITQEGRFRRVGPATYRVQMADGDWLADDSGAFYEIVITREAIRAVPSTAPIPRMKAAPAAPIPHEQIIRNFTPEEQLEMGLIPPDVKPDLRNLSIEDMIGEPGLLNPVPPRVPEMP